MSKRSWGNSKMRYCPLRKRVWQISYASNNHTLILYNDMPSYGLEREEAPTGYKEVRG